MIELVRGRAVSIIFSLGSCRNFFSVANSLTPTPASVHSLTGVVDGGLAWARLSVSEDERKKCGRSEKVREIQP